jgi:ABC-type transporter Mla subunit MlaD
MREHTRNTLVGLFMLAALVCLAVLILLFNETPILPQEAYEIEFVFPDSGGLRVGDKVHHKGMPIGWVADVRFADETGESVVIVVKIHKEVNLRRRYLLAVHGGVMGGSYAGFSDGGRRVDAVRDQFYSKQKPFDRAEGLGYFPHSMLPREVSDALKQLTEGLNSLLEMPEEPEEPAPTPPSDTGPASGPATTTVTAAPPKPRRRPNLFATLESVRVVAEDLHQIVGDQQNRQNIKEGLARFRTVAEKAEGALKDMSAGMAETAEEFKKLAAAARGMIETTQKDLQSTTRAVTGGLTNTLAKADELIAKFAHDADELAKVLAGVRKATDSLAAGEGSIGKLLTDDTFYRKLIELAEGLQGTGDELKALVTQWRKEGLRVKF